MNDEETARLVTLTKHILVFIDYPVEHLGDHILDLLVAESLEEEMAQQTVDDELDVFGRCLLRYDREVLVNRVVFADIFVIAFLLVLLLSTCRLGCLGRLQCSLLRVWSLWPTSWLLRAVLVLIALVTVGGLADAHSNLRLS